MDGIPINTADGLFDLFEIDPTAYRYVEVYKGANALRYGANSLGGAINFVTPTGRDASPFEARFDAGSFGFVRGQASTGGVSGPADWFVTGFGAARGRISRSQQRSYRAPQCELRLSVLAGCRDALLRECELVAPALAGRTDQDRGADHAKGRRPRVRAAGPAAQHRLGAARQQDHAALRSHHGGLRRFHRTNATWIIRSSGTSTTTSRTTAASPARPTTG